MSGRPFTAAVHLSPVVPSLEAVPLRFSGASAMPLGTVLPCHSEDAHALFEDIEGGIVVPIQFQPIRRANIVDSVFGTLYPPLEQSWVVY
jgi:hypothetical protein